MREALTLRDWALGWLATRECNISLARSVYPQLQWYAKDPYNGTVYSYGLLDFE
ncbi:MAG TPA: hypothetical protein VEZ14_14860 [Dehalococcoidia bacterium]|nr:hypothetical protein [Dehalococcoidia bacterium]